ncbi:nucleotide-diphospho-sugar transferase [Zopfochytrium polystomum]|nr:nucleotide-diphospho-sugar transferase [Zopfochytrium polystomum]
MMVYKSAEDPGALFSRLHLFDDKENTPGIISLHHDIAQANADILEQMVQQVPLCEFTIIDMPTCLGMAINRYNDLPSIQISSYYAKISSENGTGTPLPINVAQSTTGAIIVGISYFQIIFGLTLVIQSVLAVHRASQRRAKPARTRALNIVISTGIVVLQAFVLIVFAKPFIDLGAFALDPGSLWVNVGDSSFPGAAEHVLGAVNATDVAGSAFRLTLFWRMRFVQQNLSDVGYFGFLGLSIFNTVIVVSEFCIGLGYCIFYGITPFWRKKIVKDEPQVPVATLTRGSAKRRRMSKWSPSMTSKKSDDSEEQLGIVCIVIPVYNEVPDVLQRTIKSIVNLKYPKHLMHVIVAFDDDRETEEYEAFCGMLSKQSPPYSNRLHCALEGVNVTICRFPHGGKRHAQGHGALLARQKAEEIRSLYEAQAGQSFEKFILFMDSDMNVFEDALEALMSDMRRRKQCEAMTGLTTVRTKGSNILEIMQAIEYLRIQVLEKTFHDFFGTTTCLSGCLTLVRMDALDRVAPLYFDGVPGYSRRSFFRDDTVDPDEPLDESVHGFWRMHLGEDRWLTFLLEMHGSRFPENRQETRGCGKGVVGFCLGARASTEVPNTLKVLIQQRRRWILGMLANEIHNLSTSGLWRRHPLVTFHRALLMAGFAGGMIDLLVVLNLLFWGVSLIAKINLIILVSVNWLIIVWASLGTRQAEVIPWFPVYFLGQPILNAFYNVYAVFTMKRKTWGGPRSLMETERSRRVNQTPARIWAARVNPESVDEEFVRPEWSVIAYKATHHLLVLLLVAYTFQRGVLIASTISTVEIGLQICVLFVEVMIHSMNLLTGVANLPIPKPIRGPVVGEFEFTDERDEEVHHADFFEEEIPSATVEDIQEQTPGSPVVRVTDTDDQIPDPDEISLDYRQSIAPTPTNISTSGFATLRRPDPNLPASSASIAGTEVTLSQPLRAISASNAYRRYSVDVFVTTYKEPIETLEATLVACCELLVPPFVSRVQINVLDDHPTPEKAALCASWGDGDVVRHITRPNNLHAKAGNINNALTVTNGDLILVLDCDMVPVQEALVVLAANLLDDPMVAWVQSPQRYRDVLEGDPFCVRSQIFYDRLLPSLDARGAVPCVGTNFMIKREALLSIGGMPTDSVCEDYLMALDLFKTGWKSRYLRRNLAFGTTPQTAEEVRRQQTRWQVGGLQVIQERFGSGGMKGWRAITYLLTFINYAVYPILRLLATCFLVIYLWTDFNLFSNRIPVTALFYYPITLLQSVLLIVSPRFSLSWNMWCDLQRGGFLLANLLDAFITNGLTFAKQRTFKATVTGGAKKKKASVWQHCWFHALLALTLLGGSAFTCWRASKNHGYVPKDPDPFAVYPDPPQSPPRPLALDIVILMYALQETIVLVRYIYHTLYPPTPLSGDDRTYASSIKFKNCIDVVLGTVVTTVMLIAGTVVPWFQPGVVFGDFWVFSST